MHKSTYIFVKNKEVLKEETLVSENPGEVAIGYAMALGEDVRAYVKVHGQD